ncbi:response regulator transcription factor [bacterium]|nr:response regulator transcription factor [bacterium]
MNVLIAEDDPHTRAGLAEILQAEGYHTILAANGAEAIEKFRAEEPDFVCLDVMMPGVDGFEVCRTLRKENDSLPIIFISAKSEEIDKVLGLELGADDFIVKPFGVKEVVARIRAVTRRCMAANPEPANASFRMGDLDVIPSELRARRGEETMDLSLRDVTVLRLLYDNPGKVVDRNMLFNEIWGIDYLPNSRALDQHISQLRKRIEADPKNPTLIRTVHGVGYRYEE